MKNRMILMGLSVGIAVMMLAVGATLSGFGATRAPEHSLAKAKTLVRSKNVSQNASVIPQMQTISERVGGSGETNALTQQGFPTLPSQQQPTVAAVTPVPTPVGGAQNTTVVLQENFVDCANVPVGNTERYDYHCGLGEYWMIRKVAPGLGMALFGGNYADATFVVDGRVSGFSNPAEYGILFRFSNEDTSGYGAGVYDGQYTIFRYDNGKVVELVPYTANPNIKTGSEVNNIQVATSGSQIALYVNGALVTTITDSVYLSGGTGLYVYGAELPIEAVFDNFTVATFNQPGTVPPPTPGPSASPESPTPQSVVAPTVTPTPPQSSASQNPCQLDPGEAGFLISNGFSVIMRFTIGGGEWGTHDYDVPPDGKLYLITFPPGRYTYTASLPGIGTDHGEPYDYREGYCRIARYAP